MCSFILPRCVAVAWTRKIKSVCKSGMKTKQKMKRENGIVNKNVFIFMYINIKIMQNVCSQELGRRTRQEQQTVSTRWRVLYYYASCF